MIPLALLLIGSALLGGYFGGQVAAGIFLVGLAIMLAGVDWSKTK